MINLLNEENLIYLTRLIAAFICGGILGIEREHKSKGAGLRTYMIVCISSCMIMVLGTKCFGDTHTGDIARLGAAVVSGIGFLGAGLIFIKEDKLQNITTAAELWGAAALGLVLGYGLYFVGIVFTIMTLLVNCIVILFDKNYSENLANKIKRRRGKKKEN